MTLACVRVRERECAAISHAVNHISMSSILSHCDYHTIAKFCKQTNLSGFGFGISLYRLAHRCARCAEQSSSSGGGGSMRKTEAKIETILIHFKWMV